MPGNIDYGYQQKIFDAMQQRASGFGGGGNSALIQNAVTQAQAGQKKSNAANEARYQQGLLGLQNAQTASRGLIQQSLADLDTSGNAAKQRIVENTAKNLGQVQTSAAARGLGNFTIVDSLNRGVNKDAEYANQAVDERVAGQKSGIRMAQANNENGTAGSIAQFIANRNDVGPDQNSLASLIQGAAAGAPSGMRSGSVQHNSLPTMPQITGGGGYSGASQAGGYFTGNGTAPAYNPNQGNYVATQGITAPQMSNVADSPMSGTLAWNGNSLVQDNSVRALPDIQANGVSDSELTSAMKQGFNPPSWTETSGLNADAVKALTATRYQQWKASRKG